MGKIKAKKNKPEEKEYNLFGSDDSYDSDASEEELELKRKLEKYIELMTTDDHEDNVGDDSDDSAEDVEENESEEEEEKLTQKQTKKSSPLDDQFFNHEEFKEMFDRGDGDFELPVSDSDDEDLHRIMAEDVQTTEADNVGYSAFFDAPSSSGSRKKRSCEEDEDEEEDSEVEELSHRAKKVRFNPDAHNGEDFDEEAEEEEEDDDDEDDNNDEEEEEGHETSEAKKGRMNLFDEERNQGRVSGITNLDKRKTRELEVKASVTMVTEQSWLMAGEAKGSKRTESLVDPEIDKIMEHEERTLKKVKSRDEYVMAMIVQCIKDKAWDDPVRKVKPVYDPAEYKKRLVLDHEKSKDSLATIYEKDYLRQRDKDEEEKMNPKHVEIINMMRSLHYSLAEMSNCRLNPMPPMPEMKVVHNVAAVRMEEVQPITMSDAQILTAGEISRKPRQEVKGAMERTKTDKNRSRREKKRRQKQRRVHREKKQGQKADDADILKGIVKKAGKLAEKESGETVRTSGKFFSQYAQKQQQQQQEQKQKQQKQKQQGSNKADKAKASKKYQKSKKAA